MTTDYELMLDASYIKERRGPGRQPSHCPHKRGLNSKLHLAVDSHGMPVRLAMTAGLWLTAPKRCP